MRFAYYAEETHAGLTGALAEYGVGRINYEKPKALEKAKRGGLFGKKGDEIVVDDDDAEELVRRARAQEIDHIRVPPDPYILRLVMRARRFGGPNYSLAMKGPLRELSRTDLDLVPFITVPSHIARASILNWAGYDLAPRVHVSPWAVDFSNLPYKEGWAPVRDVFVLGTTGVENGIAFVLDVLRNVDLNITIASSEADSGFIMREVQSRQMTGRTTLVMNADKAQRLQALAKSAVAISPALANPLALPIVEAMALGRPVIAPMAGEATEVIDSKVGWLIRPAHGGDMAAALKDALEMSPERGQTMSKEAHKRAFTRYNATTVAETLLALTVLSAGTAQAS